MDKTAMGLSAGTWAGIIILCILVLVGILLPIFRRREEPSREETPSAATPLSAVTSNFYRQQQEMEQLYPGVLYPTKLSERENRKYLVSNQELYRHGWIKQEPHKWVKKTPGNLIRPVDDADKTRAELRKNGFPAGNIAAVGLEE